MPLAFATSNTGDGGDCPRLEVAQQFAVAVEEQDAQVDRRALELEAHGVAIKPLEIVGVDVPEECAAAR